MNSIFLGDSMINKETLDLHEPNRLQGGTFFSKLTCSNKPLYIQTPICTTKNGIVITGKKKYLDLIFDTEHNSFIKFIEDLENKLYNIILEKSSEWFENKLDYDDISYLSTSLLSFKCKWIEIFYK
jgi:hypothetical protein